MDYDSPYFVYTLSMFDKHGEGFKRDCKVGDYVHVYKNGIGNSYLLSTRSIEMPLCYSFRIKQLK